MEKKNERVRAHIAVNGPASLAFATSILYGHNRASVIYHYNQREAPEKSKSM